MGLRRLAVTVGVWVCALSGGFVFGVAPASAHHVRLRVFESASFGHPSSFGDPTGVAVDQATGNVYVADSDADAVDVFGAEGGSPANSVPSQITGLDFYGGEPNGVAVDNACYEHQPRLTGAACESFDPSNGDVYVVESAAEAVVKFKLNALSDAYEVTQTLSTPGIPFGVAVDTDGNVYVAKFFEQAIAQFNSDGVEVGKIDQQLIPDYDPAYVAVGEPGVLYVSGYYGGGVAKVEFNAKDEVEHEAMLPGEGGEDGKAAAVDAHGNVYVDDGSYVSEQGEAITSGLLAGSQGIAVNDETGDLYVANGGEGNLVAFGTTSVVIPDATTGVASSVGQTTATLSGTVDLEEVSLTECHFEYGTSTAYGQSVPCVPAASAIPADSNVHAVSAALAGLEPGTVYHFRLVAGNVNGSIPGGDQGFTTVAPKIVSTSASNVASTIATLSAQIDPLGEGAAYDVSYHFEYGTSTGYGASVPVPDQDIGSGESATIVSQAIAGLQPGTTYHYRVVVTNSFGTVDGPDESFTTFQAQVPGVLPDGRVYEEVTPANKGGSGDEFLSSGGEREEEYDFGNASESGDEFLFDTDATFGGNPGGSYYKSYLFTRGQDGWGITSLAAPGYGTQTVTPRAFDPQNFSQVGLEDRSGSQAGKETDYVFAGPAGGPYATALEGTVNRETFASPAELVGGGGGADGLNKLVLSSSFYDLAPGAETQEAGAVLYEWTATGGLKVVNVNTSGSLISKCGAMLGNGQGDTAGGARGAVADEGAKVFFTAPDPYVFPENPNCWTRFDPSGNEPPQLYMREDGTRTVEVSAPNRGVVDPSGAHPAEYVGASEDGSKVFFMSEAQLTADDRAHYPELYEYDTLTSTLTRVSRGDSPAAIGDVYDVPAISSDGSEVYFQAFGKLAPGAPEEKLGAESGSVNLYRYDTNTETTTYITTLNTSDYPDEYTGAKWAGFPSQEQALEVHADWYTTRDGQYLAFSAIEGEHSVLERYSAADNSIVCVSCNPTGVSTRATYFGARFGKSGNLNAGESAPAPRAMSENGSYIFFTTAEPLVPAATNGVGDVYEWHDGTISLISSGQDASPSFFLDASADGSNVFFGTHAKLVPQDTDGSGDVYDARIDGGFASEPLETAQCEGDACAGTYVVPEFATPSSLTFSGPGNVPAAGPEPKALGKPKKRAKPNKKKKSKKRAKKSKHARRARRSTRSVDSGRGEAR